MRSSGCSSRCNSIQKTQDAFVARLAELEAILDHSRQTALGALCTIVKVKADSQRIGEKSMRIA